MHDTEGSAGLQSRPWKGRLNIL